MNEEGCPKCPEGAPAWLATFADLMSLLMCFFVLLLSFAEIDAIRFKKMAESMKDAFGVQREIPANEIVKGTSVVMQHFSPATPEPTLIEEIRQSTTEPERENPDVEETRLLNALLEDVREEVEEVAEQLERELEREIAAGLVEIETTETKVIVRIQERGSFPSGSASLDPDFYSVIAKIGDVLSTSSGDIVVAGHTDDVPISTQRFRSNWELSGARAVTVAHAMLSNPLIDPARLVVEGHAEAKPLVPNDSSENRAMNRRVEMVLELGKDIEDAAREQLIKRIQPADNAAEANHVGN